MNIFWGQEVLWHPWKQLSELWVNWRVNVLQWLHWHLWLSELLTLLKVSQCCTSLLWRNDWKYGCSASGDSQRLQLQAASRNEHLSPVPVKPLSCLAFALPLKLLSPGPDLQRFRLLPFLLKANSSILPLSGSCESLSCGFQSFSVNWMCLWFNWEIVSSFRSEICFLCVADIVTQPWEKPITHTQNKLWQPPWDNEGFFILRLCKQSRYWVIIF